MARSISFEWLGGLLKVRQEKGLVVEADNLLLEFMQREVDIKGPFMNYEEHLINKRGEKKVVYVNFAFPIRGFSREVARDMVLSTGDFSIGPFGISYTKLGDVGKYLTIYMPPGFLYEIAILTERKLALFMIARRQVFLLEERLGFRKLLFL